MGLFRRRDNDYMTMSVQKPLARSENLVVEDLQDEVLIYDELSARAHCLSGPAAMVWRSCDGTMGVAELATDLNLDADSVKQALSELESNGLLDSLAVLSNGNGHTRREFSIGAVKAGAAVGAAPMIYSILTPTPAAALTPSVAQCLFYSAQSCDGCTNVCGCCCCCQGCSTATQAACKICLPTTSCSTFSSGCSNVSGVSGSCSSGPNCSVKAPNGPVCGPDVPLVPSG